MRRAILAVAVVTAVFSVAACGETYNSVNSNQVVVRDENAKVDSKNILYACARKGRQVAKVEWSTAGDDNDVMALVTCGGSLTRLSPYHPPGTGG